MTWLIEMPKVAQRVAMADSLLMPWGTSYCGVSRRICRHAAHLKDEADSPRDVVGRTVRLTRPRLEAGFSV